MLPTCNNHPAKSFTNSLLKLFWIFYSNSGSLLVVGYSFHYIPVFPTLQRYENLKPLNKREN